MNGRILGIKIGDTFVPCEMSCDISIDGERIATSSKENGNWRNSIAGYRSWKASVNGKFELNSAEASEAGSLGLIQAIIDGVNVELVMTLRIDSTQSLLIGGIAGTTNISISAGSTGEATWSGNFDGVGLLDLDYNFGAGYLRDNDGDKIVDSEGFGILLAEGDINFPNGVSQVSPAGTKILVADTNDEIAWVDPSDISENSYTTADKNKLASMTAIFTTALKTAYDGAVIWISTNGSALIAHLTRTDNPHSVTKAQVGLSAVANTAPADLPISSATQTALDGKLSDITGLIEAGDNITLDGSGTDADPYIISSSGGSGGDTPDATSTVKGKLRLANHLGGTAENPTVVKVDDQVSSDNSDKPANTAFVQTGLATKANIAAGTGTLVDLTFVADSVQGTIASPLTGNITGNVTGAQLGVVTLVIHNHSSAPTFDSKYKKLSGSGSYVTGSINYIFCAYINATEIIYSINQRT